MKHRKQTKKQAKGRRTPTPTTGTSPVRDPAMPQAKVPPASQGRWALLLIGLGWALLFFSALVVQDFHPVMRTYFPAAPKYISWYQLFIMLAVGFFLAAKGFRRIPERPESDVSPREALVWLAAIAVLASVLRLYQFDKPFGRFWDDWAYNVLIGHYILDDGKLYLMFPYGGREPFYAYFLTGVRMLMPDVRTYEYLRLSTCLVDLLTLWVLYRTGKELVSRRAGLVVAALGAANKPMLQMYMAVFRAGTVVLSVSLQILTLIRLFKKPTLSRFIQWGLATAFGVHTYSTFRPFMLIVPFLLLAWILIDPKERRLNAMSFLAFGGILFSLMAVYDNMFAAIHPGLEVFVASWQKWAGSPIVIVMIFLVLMNVYWASTRRTGGGSKLVYLALAACVAGLLCYPLSRDRDFVERLPALSVFRKDEFSEQGIQYLLNKATSMLRSMFFRSPDRNDLVIHSEPFYDLFSQGAIALGLAWFIARPDWKKALLLFLAAVGTLVRLLSVDPAGTKLVASIPGFFLLAGWAVSRLWALIPPRSLGGPLLAVLLAAYWIWGAWIQHQKIYDYWGSDLSPEVRVSRLVERDEPRHRVYLANSPYFYSSTSQYVLNQGRRYYFLKNHNNIPLLPGEVPQNVVVILQEGNQNLMAKLKKQFPTAQWERLRAFSVQAGENYNPENFMWRVLVLGSALSDDPRAILYRQEQTGPWLCRYYMGNYGWGLGGILREERFDSISRNAILDEFKRHNLQDPDFFRDYGLPRTIEITGALEVPESGEYEISILPVNPVWLRVDGKTVLKTRKQRREPEIRGLWLEKGSHNVEVRMRIWDESGMPEFLIRDANSDEAAWKVL